MEFSRAVAYACFTAMKWLLAVVAVLFAALALQAYFEAAPRGQIQLFLTFCLGIAFVSGLMHWLAKRISR